MSTSDNASHRSHSRVGGIDAVRGLVMVLMALDHSREYIVASDPTDLEQTTVALFLTRWVTHLCAPAFVFLAGVSAWLREQQREWTRTELSRYLATRGCWLIALDVCVIRVLWWFNFDFHLIVLGVLWAIGGSMIVLAAALFGGRRFVAGAGIFLVVMHNAFDAVQFDPSSPLPAVWSLLHVQRVLSPFDGYNVVVGYPLIPWVGLMMIGYASGVLWSGTCRGRRRFMSLSGAAMLLAFVLLRYSNVYADPSPWVAQDTPIRTVFSFLNCTKYPPSLCYLLMTCGPMLILLAAVEGNACSGPLRILQIFGRVPLFFYLVHIPVAHCAGIALSYGRYGRAEWWFHNPPFSDMPDDYGWGLIELYAIWAASIAMLLPICVLYRRLQVRRVQA